jgi:hypothetical protein
MTIYFPQGAVQRVVAQTAWRSISACSEYVCFCGPLSMSTHALNDRVGGCEGCGESGSEGASGRHRMPALAARAKVGRRAGL